jgi:hypothetical protein
MERFVEYMKKYLYQWIKPFLMINKRTEVYIIGSDINPGRCFAMQIVSRVDVFPLFHFM